MEYKYPPSFCGDGRVMVAPTHQPMGARGIKVSGAQAKRIVDSLFETGQSAHSPLGDTVWVVQLALHYNMCGYTMRYANGTGFHFEIDKETT